MRITYAAFVLLGCAPKAAECPPTAPAVAPVARPSVQPAPIESEHQVGDRVWIAFGESWYPGRVAAVLAPAIYEVAYDGYAADWNRVARPGQLRPFDSPPTSDGPPTAPSFVPDPGIPVDDISQLHAGMAVLILWNDMLWPGTVVELEGDRVHIRYDGYDESSDETVAIERLSIPPAVAERR